MIPLSLRFQGCFSPYSTPLTIFSFPGLLLCHVCAMCLTKYLTTMPPKIDAFMHNHCSNYLACFFFLFYADYLFALATILYGQYLINVAVGRIVMCFAISCPVDLMSICSYIHPMVLFSCFTKYLCFWMSAIVMESST